MDKAYRKQQGSVLIVSLLILLVLTIIGATALNDSVMEERMAANFQTGNSAYQAAESAVNSTFVMIANDFAWVQAAMNAQAVADQTGNPAVWPTTPPVVINASSAGLGLNNNSTTTLNSTISYHGPGMGENCSVRLCGAQVVRVEGTGSVNNTNISRTHFLGVKKNAPKPPQ